MTLKSISLSCNTAYWVRCSQGRFGDIGSFGVPVLACGKKAAKWRKHFGAFISLCVVSEKKENKRIKKRQIEEKNNDLLFGCPYTCSFFFFFFGHGSKKYVPFAFCAFPLLSNSWPKWKCATVRWRNVPLHLVVLHLPFWTNPFIPPVHMLFIPLLLLKWI